VATPLRSGALIEIGPYRIRASLAEGMQQFNNADDLTMINIGRAAVSEGEKTIISQEVTGAVLQTSDTASKQVARVSGSSDERRSAHKKSSAPDHGSGHLASSFVDAFADGASVEPDILAGRTDRELAHELGRTMQSVAHGLFALTKSVNQMRELIGSEQSADYGIASQDSQNSSQRVLQFLLAINQAGYGRSDEILGDMVADLVGHEHAMFGAMQAALFRLLNELSPTTIEAKSGKGFFKSKKSAHWDDYVDLWANLSAKSENGLLDVYLDYFKQAYDNKMNGI
jgi:type VI secretion system protein ImpI